MKEYQIQYFDARGDAAGYEDILGRSREGIHIARGLREGRRVYAVVFDIEAGMDKAAYKRIGSNVVRISIEDIPVPYGGSIHS